MNGFTGSPVWHMLYSFPPNDFEAIARGYDEFAERWGPIIDVFDAEGVRFALEVHPTEIAYDFVTTRRALDAIGNRPGFGINFDPSHLAHQFLDSAAFVEEFRRLCQPVCAPATSTGSAGSTGAKWNNDSWVTRRGGSPITSPTSPPTHAPAAVAVYTPPSSVASQ